MTTTAAEPYLTYTVRQEVKPGKLEGLSEKLIEQHWKLYEGYVTNTNLLNKAIWDCLESGGEVNKPNMAELQRRLGFEYDGMILHEYYFGALAAGSQEPAPTSAVGKKLASDFGSFERWKKQFSEIGKMRGIGWVITNYDPLAQRLVTFWVGDHELGNIAGFIPIIVMDMWEHAYVTDFGASAAGRAEYLQAYLKNLNWDVVAKRLEAAQKSQVYSRIAK